MRPLAGWVVVAYLAGQLIGISGCSSYFRKIKTYTPLPQTVTYPITRIQFGSCNESSDVQPFWPVLAAREPDLFIWLGDIVYPDPILPLPVINLDRLAHLYAVQKEMPAYATFRQQVPILGIYDDHDYGWDNGGKYYPFKEHSMQHLLDFLDEPVGSIRRRQAGAYASYTLGAVPHQVKIILLDTRFNREDPGPKADMLGEHQWQWLKQELTHSSAQVHLLCSSISIMSTDRYSENWSQFPASKDRLYSMLDAYHPEGLVLLTGDKHFGELHRDTIGHQVVYELLSSGLTHYNEAPLYLTASPPQTYVGLNAGEVNIDWTKSNIALLLLNEAGEVVIRQEVMLPGILAQH